MKRPAPIDQDASENTNKRVKFDKNTASRTSRSTEKFSTGDAVRALWRTQNPDLLIQGLTTLRNQLTVKHDEPPISPQDERLLLVQQWLAEDASVREIFELWETVNSKNTSLHTLIVSLLSTILSLVSSHFTYHAIGNPIIKTLLTPGSIRWVNSYIGGSNNELILVTLKLYNAMSAFAGGKDRKTVLEVFPWELKSLPKLLKLRRKGKGCDYDPFARPDIRTLYVTFLLSFVQPDSPSHVKTTFLEHHRDAFLAVFKGLSEDPYLLVRRVLEVSWSGLWLDPKVKRTLKIGLFNEVTFGHLIKLYARNTSEGDDPEHVPADLVHHFFLAISSRPGVGICFKDRGWYPREQEGEVVSMNEDQEEPSSVSRGSRIYNKILSNILKTLKVNEDPRQQELAVKIMSACPELVAGYWPAAALTLEPRLSSRWLANIAFFGTIISLPVPTSSFFLRIDDESQSRSGSYQPTPPPLNTIMENILPSVNTKINFTKGLQSTSGLVQHCTALALTKCLMKYDLVERAFMEIATSLEEDEEDGQWRKRIREVEKEVRRRVPEFQVVVAFSQHVSAQDAGNADVKSGSGDGGKTVTPNATRTALLAESTQRLLWMYHRHLPAVTAEARFDVGKLLQGFVSEGSKGSEDEDEEGQVPEAVGRLDRVRRLHVIRLLKESDSFAWTGKLPGTSRSHLYVLLKTFMNAQNDAERAALRDLLNHILSQTILFQEDPDEPSLWLSSLPTTRRTPSSISADGAALTDEDKSVITFLDDCIQRGMKTPYRYIEDLQTLVKTTSDMGSSTPGLTADALESYPSPLLMTVSEQLNAKVGHKLLSPSDLLALASFVRKLIVNLSVKVLDLSILRAVGQKMDEILAQERLFAEYPVLSRAVRREVKLMEIALARLVHEESGRGMEVEGVSEEVAEFLTEVAKLSPPSSPTARANTAFELIDWVRLVDEPIGPEEVNCIMDVVMEFHPQAISTAVDYLDPSQHSVWDSLDVEECATKYTGCFSFQQLFLHADGAVLSDDTARGLLSQALFASSPMLLDVKRAMRLVAHGLSPAVSREEPSHELLLLLSTLVKDAARSLSATDFDVLKEEMFVRQGNLKTLCITEGLSRAVRKGLNRLVHSTLYPVTERNRYLVADITAYWVNVIRGGLESDDVEPETVTIWIDHFPMPDLFSLFDDLARVVDDMPSPLRTSLLNSVLSAIKANIGVTSGAGDQLGKRLPLFLHLREILQDYAALEDLIAAAIGDSLPLYAPAVAPVSQNADGTSDLTSTIKMSEKRWFRAREPLPSVTCARQLLEQRTWTRSTVDILRGLAYRRVIDQDLYASWLKSNRFRKRTVGEYIPVLHAFVDRMVADGDEITAHNINIFVDIFENVIQAVSNPDLPSEHRSMAASSAAKLLQLTPSRTSYLISQALNSVKSLDPHRLTTELLFLVWEVHKKTPNDAMPLVTTTMEAGLRCFVILLGDYPTSSDLVKTVLQGLSPLVQTSKGVGAQYVETLLGVVTQNHFKEPEMVKLTTATLSSTSLKPLVVNRHLQSILQHPQLDRLCSVSGETRDAIVSLLFSLFQLHPSNTMQVTHIEPLIGIYRGTLSSSDLKLLSVFQLFEQERKLSVSALFSRWSASAGSASSTALEAIQSLDPGTMFRTGLHYPRWRRLEDQSKYVVDGHDAQLYDPVFVILLFGAMLSEEPPSSAFGWVELFRTNVVGLLIRFLSSKESRLRDLALCHLSALWKLLQDADMHEKPHVMYILGLLKNVFAQPAGDAPKRLSSYSTLILLHALRGVFYPSNFIYPLTARFLLQRPELDTNDVPMLFGMLYSSSDDWKKERAWIIRLLADGMMSSDDWRVLKRRHTWDLLASLFQSSYSDPSLQRGILEVLANLTRNARAMQSLILKSSLLTWVHMQLLNPSNNHDLSWAKILANIVFLADANKLEAATSGQWRMVICQSLSILLDPSRCTNVSALLQVVSPTILKLSGISSSDNSLASLLARALRVLTTIEPKVDVSAATQVIAREFALPPYSSTNLHISEHGDPPLSIWGKSVEMLWHAAMNLDSKPVVWEALTVRILTWRSMAGAEVSPIGEWARTFVVQNIGIVQKTKM